jgi:hypothetical protein
LSATTLPKLLVLYVELKISVAGNTIEDCAAEHIKV